VLKLLTNKLKTNSDLAAEEITAAISAIMAGSCPGEEVSGFLLALKDKGETATEIAGAARAVRQHMTHVKSSWTDLLDTCGTGGDDANTFNISTAAAIVAAAAGAHVAKHGNRSVSSKSGSADVLRELGVNVDASLEQVERCLQEVGICFCFAPVMHPAMKSVAEVRRQLGVPTIFNLLGPLCNPAQTPFQLLGVGQPGLLSLMAEVLHRLGCQRSVVVSGADGLDEISLAVETNVRVVTPQGIVEAVWSPNDFGVVPTSMESLIVDGPAQSANVIRGLLAGEPGPARDIVVLNAAAAIWTAGLEQTLSAAAERVCAAIVDQRATETLERLVDCSAA
jgi:anthranilate phosphoribosyltransferase